MFTRKRLGALSMAGGVVLLIVLFVGLFQPHPLAVAFAAFIGIPGLLLAALGAVLLIVEGETLALEPPPSADADSGPSGAARHG